ncbi:hypothetical protein OC861_002345 [Tilletia horrida]|nr:hypothetical protein OC861_002345 [Tilletia horrida]
MVGPAVSSGLWRRPNENDDSEDTTSSEEEEELLSTDSESDEPPHHTRPCICDLDGLLTSTVHLGPADISRQDQVHLASEAKGNSSTCPCPLTLFKAHALLDELLDRPATRVKKGKNPSNPHTSATLQPDPHTKTRTWEQLDSLLQVLTIRGRLHNLLSTSAYDSSIDLYAEEAKAISKILQRARALPEPESATTRSDTDAVHDGFIVSLQRNYLRQAAHVLHRAAPEPDRLDEETPRNWLPYRCPYFDSDPQHANSSPAQRAIIHDKHLTFLRSGTRRRSNAQLRTLLQQYVLPVLASFDRDATDRPDPGVAPPILIWLNEATPLPNPIRSLVENIYRCVSCGIPVGGTLITSLEAWQRHPDRTTAALNSIALPSLREQYYLPALKTFPNANHRSSSNKEPVILGGIGPWLLHRPLGEQVPAWARLHESLLFHDETFPSNKTDLTLTAEERVKTGTLVEDLDWRFCPTCAFAHLGPEEAEQSGIQPCQCLLCTQTNHNSNHS